MSITEAEIKERVQKNRREYMKEWRSKYKEKNGISYTTVCAMRKAERQLKEEKGIQ